MTHQNTQILNDPKDDGKGWLSSHMAQFMVFLNGLILTFTAFFILSIFIGEMQSDSFQENTNSTFLRIESELNEVERSFEALNTTMEETGRFDANEITALIDAAQFFQGIRYIDLSQNGQIYKEYGQVPFDKEAPPALQRVTENVEIYRPNNGVQGTALLFRKKINVEGRNFLSIGVMSLDQMMNRLLLEDLRHVVDDLTMMEENGSALYSYHSDTSGEPKGSDVLNSKKTFMIGDLSLQIDAHFIKDQRTDFLEKIPFLMLLFGVTLTLIGTLYVRNNQKQSLKLAQMNRVLAMKNLELNNEVLTREKLNKMIRKSEKENRAILNAVTDIIFETDELGNLIFLNAAWHRITGFDSKGYIGKSLIGMLHPQDQEEQLKRIRDLIEENGKPYTAYTRLRIHNGTFRAVELSISMLRHDDNGDLRIVGTITDVEERRRAERALGEAEKKYRTIVENAAGGIFQLTPEGHFLSVNPALAAILGYEAPEKLLRAIKNVNRDVYVDTAARKSYIDTVKKVDGAVYKEMEAFRSDGEKIWIGENMRAVKNEDGEVLYYEGSIEDISARKQTERELKEAKIKSDVANRAKSEFLANMSHELRTPLNAIIGFSEIIKNQIFGPIGQEAYHDYALDIHDSGKKLLEVINNILDVSRIEVGDRQLNESMVELQKIIPMCLKLIEPKFETKKIKIIYDVEKTYPRLVGEELAIKQMIMNLLSNAIKYSPDEGLVTMVCDIDDSNGDLKISITDTGVGMDEDEIDSALTPFNSQNASSAHKAGWNGTGTGLGLTLVDSLIKLHGGELQLISKKGVGTTATLVFPAKRVAKPNAAAEEARKKKLKDKTEDETILTKDDAADQDNTDRTIH